MHLQVDVVCVIAILSNVSRCPVWQSTKFHLANSEMTDTNKDSYFMLQKKSHRAPGLLESVRQKRLNYSPIHS